MEKKSEQRQEAETPPTAGRKFHAHQTVSIDGQPYIVMAVNAKGHMIVRPAGQKKEDTETMMKRLAAQEGGKAHADQGN